MTEAAQTFIFMANPLSIWVVALAMPLVFVIGRRRAAIDPKPSVGEFVTYVFFGGIVGLLIGAVVLAVLLGILGGPVLLIIVFWPLALSCGAVLGTVLWWRQTLK
jgi:hypothetical protein